MQSWLCQLRSVDVTETITRCTFECGRWGCGRMRKLGPQRGNLWAKAILRCPHRTCPPYVRNAIPREEFGHVIDLTTWSQRLGASVFPDRIMAECNELAVCRSGTSMRSHSRRTRHHEAAGVTKSSRILYAAEEPSSTRESSRWRTASRSSFSRFNSIGWP